jgi:MoxR-like ATPase
MSLDAMQPSAVPPQGTTSVERLGEVARAVRESLARHVVGQEAAIDTLLASYMAGGHVLIEGVPGIAKTLLARCFAAALGVELARIQFTPDLMPADILGTNVFDQKAGSFRLVRGPIFTPMLMADEVNRTPPKTQAALLEAMQERQATIDGVTYPLPPNFFVVATQNPLEFEGVYPLPEAQLDRFLVKIEMGLPEPEAELAIYRRAVDGELVGWDAEVPLPAAVASPEDALALRRAARRVHVAPELLGYLAQLAQGVRGSPHVELGPSPRGGLALLATARAGALLAERDFVAPDDLKRLLVPCWGHRLLLTAESELEGYTARRILDEVAAAVEVPR